MKRIKTSKQNKRTYKNKRHTKTRRRMRGGGEKEQKERIIKDNFRNMFMNSFKKLQYAVRAGNMERVKEVTEIFKNGFKSNQIGINTLIPITTNSIPINKYNYSQSVTPLIAFVPSLVVIFDNIDDFITRKAFINNFILNKGNINLLSYTHNISALSAAIKLQDKELVKYLLEKGADVKLLTEEQRSIMENLIKDEEIEAIIEPTPVKPIVKLTLPTELPSDSGYNPDVEPEFWKPIFQENEMLSIRTKINEMMNS
jgi:ankyrin repeat protein